MFATHEPSGDCQYSLSADGPLCRPMEKTVRGLLFAIPTNKTIIKQHTNSYCVDINRWMGTPPVGMCSRISLLDEDEVSKLKTSLKVQFGFKSLMMSCFSRRSQHQGSTMVFFLNIAGCWQLIKVTSCGFKCQACLI